MVEVYLSAACGLEECGNTSEALVAQEEMITHSMINSDFSALCEGVVVVSVEKA